MEWMYWPLSFLFSWSFKTANKYMAIIIHTQSITFQQSRVKNALFPAAGVLLTDRPSSKLENEVMHFGMSHSFAQTSKEINNSKRNKMEIQKIEWWKTKGVPTKTACYVNTQYASNSPFHSSVSLFRNRQLPWNRFFL